MSVPLLVQNTRYYAGVSLPFFISHGMVESRAEDLGFASIEWHDRDSGAPPVDPHGDPSYSDDWDEWASAVYVGHPGQIQLPAKPAWIVAAPPPSGTAPRITAPDATQVYAEAAQSNDPVKLAVAANLLVKLGRTDLAETLAARYQSLTNVPLPGVSAPSSAAPKVALALLGVVVVGGAAWLAFSPPRRRPPTFEEHRDRR